MSANGERYLVVSLGSIGRRHLRNLKALRPSADVAALRLSGSSLPVEGCERQLMSWDEVARFAPAAAIVASPASTHLAAATCLLELGVPVLMEKPMAGSVDGLGELVQTARERSLPLMVGYNLRFKRSLAEARRLVLAGEIGEVMAVRAEVGQHLPDWRPQDDYRLSVSAQRKLGGGALLELSHEIDYLYWCFGMPARVTARGGRYSSLEIDVEDCVELCMEYEQPRRLISVHLDFLQRKAARHCKFIGSKATLVWDGLADTVLIEGDGPASRVALDEPDRNDMYLRELSHFLDCVERKTPLLVDAEQGYDVMAIIEAARKSMETGMVERPIAWREAAA